jgi:hypothetical protein
MDISLPNIKESRIGIIYVYYERKNQQKNQTNISFFIKHGLRNNKWLNLNIETLFVINGNQCEVVIPNKPNINILKEENCSDWEGWLNGIKFYEKKYNKPIWEIFDYLNLINCGCFGPIYEDNIQDHWLFPFYNRMLKYNAVICSPCLSFLPNTNPGGTGPKVVPTFSLLRCSEHIIRILTTEQISCKDESSINDDFGTHTNTVWGKKYDKMDAVLTGEYGLSRILINNGYKVTSLLYDFDCHDEKYWSINNNREPDRFNTFNGTNIPLSTIFIKNLWRWGNHYVGLPVLYNECINFMYSKLNMTPLLNYKSNIQNMISPNYNYDLLSISQWNSKEEYYNNYGYVEEEIIFLKPEINPKNCVIYTHYDSDNIIKDYVIQSINALIYVGYDIIFYTSSETINNIDQSTLPFTINYIENNGPGTDWEIWHLVCKKIVEQNKIYDNILLLNDSIILPINGIENFKNTIAKMRNSSDFWGHWDSNEVEWHIVGTPIEFKYKMINDILGFFNSHLEILKSEPKNIRWLNIILKVEVKFAKYLCNLGYKHNVVINSQLLDNTVTCPPFNPTNIYRWINNPNTFGIKWKYNISYLHPELISSEFNYLTRFLYYGKNGTISKGERDGAFSRSSYDL